MSANFSLSRRRVVGALAAAGALGLAGCTGVPPNVRPVRGFQLERYLGKWYEIARLDHSFERGLERVTAEYAMRPDGDVEVVNRGYDVANKRWKQAVGRARFTETPDVGRLKVSFFGPFWGGYNIAELAPDYGHALVTGPDTSYLWILARQPTLPKPVLDRLVGRARELGFPVEQLIYVKQTE